METESSWIELGGIIFFTWMVVIVGLLWGLSIKASYNEEKQKQKQQQELKDGQSNQNS
jgi:preprotein translocase subunit YajC